MSHAVMLAIPHVGSLAFRAARGIFRASEQHEVSFTDFDTSNLAWGFNTLWCRALNAYEAGEITHLAFLHADIGPKDFWIDTLIEVMEEHDADLVSAISPIKDPRGLTSTGVGVEGLDWSPLRRFTLQEVHRLPETFDAEAAGYPGKVLLHNSGCWVADLRREVFRTTDEEGVAKAYFTLRDRVVKSEGTWVAQCESEDWFFSRRLHELEAKTFVTRRLPLGHFGTLEFRNDTPWGLFPVDFDTSELWIQENPAQYIQENGAWTPKMMPFHAFDPGLAAAIGDMIDPGVRIVDLGCGPGKYVEYLNQHGFEAIGLDGNPVTKDIENCHVADLTSDSGIGGFFQYRYPDWTICMEVGEHIPREKERTLIDSISCCRKGAIVSWAVPGQPGQGHVNCRTENEVISLLEEEGMAVNWGKTYLLRGASQLWLANENLLVFEYA